MAKMMKRLMAWAIVLSMFLSVIALPTSAEENIAPENGSGEPVTVTVEIRNAAGDVIGEKTVVTTVETDDTADSYSQRTDMNSTWKTQETQTTDGGTETQGSTTTQTTGQVLTQVEGSETGTENVHADKTTGVQTYSGADSGSESTTITDTTTTVTTTEGVVISDETAPTQTVLQDDVQQGDWSDLTLTEEGKWTPGNLDDQTYKPTSDTTPTIQSSTPVEVDEDPLSRDDAILTMTAPTGTEPSTDSDTLYISIEDALANDISYTDGQILGDGSVVNFVYDEDGETLIGYTITKYTPTGSDNGDIQAGATGPEVAVGDEITTYTKPENYEVCIDAPIYDDNNNQIGTRTVEEILDDDGNVIGYTITETTNTPVSNLPNNTSIPLNVPETFRTLPDRPVEPEPVTQGGMTTTVTVEDILEGGEVVGYKTTTTVTDEDGNVAYSASETIYGTLTSYSSSLDTTPTSSQITTTTTTTVYGIKTTQNYTRTTPGTQTSTNTRDVSQEIYELLNTEDGLFFLYEGKMYAVQAITSASSDALSQGRITLTTLTPNLTLEPSGWGAINSDTDLRGSYPFSFTDSHESDYPLQYVDYGLESRIEVNYGSGTTLAHQFVLEDPSGNKHYVYCADFSTTAVRGENYNMTNVVDSGYFDDLATARKVEVIALNGYWGTDSGIGSLSHVQQILKDARTAGLISLTDDEINGITPGEALTATQAALWRYADSAGNTSMGDNIVGNVYNDSSDPSSTRAANDSEKKIVNALYKALINLNPETTDNTTTEMLDTDNFATQTQLVIKEKAVDGQGAVRTHEITGSEVYIADLTFTMDVSKSDLTGNLVITITDQYDNVIRTEQLSTESSNLVGRVLADGSAGTDYTIKDLELAEGVKINLNLSGTQNLQQGAYLYSADVYSTSQTFIGVASGTQQVNLNVQMEFSVTDPKAEVQHSTASWSEVEVDTQSYAKVDTYSREKTGTSTTQTVSVNTQVFATTVKTDTATETTKKERSWFYSYLYQLTTVNGDGGGGGDGGGDGDGGGGGGGDSEVARADAPQTGDITGILALICLFSAGGIMVLNRKREEDA